jgi:hypothetical protein
LQTYGTEFEPGILFHQRAGVLGGLFLILLGVAILYTIAYWARRGRRVEGEVIGVRRRNGQFHSVYRYALPEGGFHEATSVQGSSSLYGRGTGTRRMIHVIPEHAEEAREPAAPVTWALAWGLVLGGGWITWFNATTWKRSIFTWIFFALVAAILGRFIWHKLTRFLNALQTKVGVAEPWDALPIENVERLGSISQTPRVQIVSKGPIRAPMIFVVVGLVAWGIAFIPARKLILLRSGTRTEGTVLWLNEDTTQRGSYSKFPEVQFTDLHGKTVRFLDKVGADPSPYHLGDRVPVLYQPDKQGSAMIDHGRGNWEPVVALMVLGTTLLGVGLLASRGSVVVGSQTRPAKSYSV